MVPCTDQWIHKYQPAWRFPPLAEFVAKNYPLVRGASRLDGTWTIRIRLLRFGWVGR